MMAVITQFPNKKTRRRIASNMEARRAARRARRQAITGLLIGAALALLSAWAMIVGAVTMIGWWL